MIEHGLAIAKVVIVIMMVLNLVPILIWMERKGAAYIQDRRGPNRAALFGIIRLGGLIHSLADAIKLITKGDTTNEQAYSPLFILAPMIALFVVVVTLAVIPFAEPLHLGNVIFHFQIADLEGGLLYVLALSSLSVYALLLAGWSSGNKYSLLGALRGASQMLSYELAMALSVVALFLVAGSFRLNDIVADQGSNLFSWNAVRLPLAFLLFFVALFAETNRLPFDLPEGEAEITAGFHTEYSSMRFAVFFMAEYAHIIVGSLLVSLLFFGGWHLPFVSTTLMREHIHSIIPMTWIGLIFLYFLVGLFLTRRYFKRRGYWGDNRDLESLLFGAGAHFMGFVFFGTYFIFSSHAIPEGAIALFLFFLQLIVLLTKTLFFVSVFIWVRWTLPRFRYDQLMRLGWKVLLPLGIVNVVIAA